MTDRPAARVCLHCRDPARRVNRPRGLCWACFYALGVRELYPVSGGKYARRGAGLGTGPRPLPEPTAAPPGSEEKVLALVGRAERGEELWHPLDGPAAGVRGPDDHAWHGRGTDDGPGSEPGGDAVPGR